MICSLHFESNLFKGAKKGKVDFDRAIAIYNSSGPSLPPTGPSLPSAGPSPPSAGPSPPSAFVTHKIVTNSNVYVDENLELISVIPSVQNKIEFIYDKYDLGNPHFIFLVLIISC